MGKNSTVLAGIVVIIYTASLASLVNSARNEFVVPDDVDCICSGSVVTYECRIVGAGNTQWTGSLFDCVQDEIVLRHDRFSGGAAGDCNQGAVMAQSIGVDNNCYTSQLSFTANVALNNKTVLCIHNSASGNILIGTAIPTIIGGNFPPPENVFLTSVRQRMLTFSWTPPATMCTSLAYNITSSCGSCPASTNTTAVTCTNLQVSSLESNCTFSVHSMVCGTTGQASVPVTMRFKVPDAPRITILPVYSSSNNMLSKVLSRVSQESFSNLTFTNGEIGIVDSYRIHINTDVVTANPSCPNDECEYLSDVPPNVCSRSKADISVSIKAKNELGQSALSETFNFGCKNEFVSVEYDPFTASITCHFLNMSDNTLKTCFVQYGLCSEAQNRTIIGSNNSDTVILMLNIDGSDREYCYTITAISGTRTVVIEGRTAQSGGLSPAEVIVIIVTLIVVTVVVVFLIGIYCRVHYGHSNKSYGNLHGAGIPEVQPLDTFRSRVLKRYYQSEVVIVQYEVQTDCSLEEFLGTKGLTLKRGCVLCEVKNREMVTEDMILILVKTTASGKTKYYTLDKGSDVYKEGVISPSSFEDYSIFIQSKSGGRRYLERRSKLLYMFTNLWCVVRDDFVFVPPAMEDRQLNSIVNDEVNQHVNASQRNFYFAFESSTDEEQLVSGTNVILENKSKKSKSLLTGPHARIASHQHELDRNQWRVYVLKEYQDDMMVPKNTFVMYKAEREYPSVGVPIVYTPIHAKQFERKEVKEDHSLKLRQFRQMFDLSPDEPVFIEIGGGNVGDAGKKALLDVIITDKEMATFFTCSCKGDEFKAALKNEVSGIEQSWKFFVLCTDEETSVHSWVLYNSSVSKTLWASSGLLPIHSDRFVSSMVEEGNTIEQIIETSKLEKDCAIFLGSDCVQNVSSVRDVILMETKKHEDPTIQFHRGQQSVDSFFYSGPLARSKFKSFENPDVQKKFEEDTGRKFLLLCSENSSKVTRMCNIYYETFQHIQACFILLTVTDRDNVRMSDFIEKELGGTNGNFAFESSKAFYELKEEEDLLYFREIVIMTPTYHRLRAKFVYPAHGEVAVCSYESFYKVSDEAPGFGVKLRPKTESRSKRFIQSMPHGSRCLKKWETVLYKKD